MPACLVECFPKAKVDAAWTCTICISGEKETPALELPCGHAFHSGCVVEWLSKHRSVCPCCYEPADIELFVAKRKCSVSGMEPSEKKPCLGRQVVDEQGMSAAVVPSAARDPVRIAATLGSMSFTHGEIADALFQAGSEMLTEQGWTCLPWPEELCSPLGFSKKDIMKAKVSDFQ